MRRRLPRLPRLPLLVLSQYVEERYASDLIAAPSGPVADVGDFIDSVQRIAGRLDNQLETDAAAKSTVRATVSAGALTLRNGS